MVGSSVAGGGAVGDGRHRIGDGQTEDRHYEREMPRRRAGRGSPRVAQPYLGEHEDEQHSGAGDGDPAGAGPPGGPGEGDRQGERRMPIQPWTRMSRLPNNDWPATTAWRRTSPASTTAAAVWPRRVGVPVPRSEEGQEPATRCTTTLIVAERVSQHKSPRSGGRRRLPAGHSGGGAGRAERGTSLLGLLPGDSTGLSAGEHLNRVP